MPVNLAIIGGGRMAQTHINAARASEGKVTIAAVVDPSEPARRAAAEASGASAFVRIEDMLDDPVGRDIQAVLVCTPPSVRLHPVRAALERGLAVMVEKPLAHNVEDATELTDLAENFGEQVTAVGYCHRFAPALEQIKRRVNAGELGTISRFENTFAGFAPQMREHWMSDPEASGGGSFIDTGCHSLDMFLHLFGPARVQGAVLHHVWPGRGESSATVLVRSIDNGVAGAIQSGWMETPRFTVNVVGAAGSLFYDYNSPTTLILRPKHGAERRIEVEPHDLRFRRQLENFAALVEGKTPEIVPATFREGLLVAQWVSDAYRLAGSRDS